MNTRIELKFQECDSCKAKPGSPILCDGCINNRAVIDILTEGKPSYYFQPGNCKSTTPICFDHECSIHGR